MIVCELIIIKSDKLFGSDNKKTCFKMLILKLLNLFLINLQFILYNKKKMKYDNCEIDNNIRRI